MESTDVAPQEPDRDVVLLRACAPVLPTVVLAMLLNVKPLAVNRRKAKLGIDTSLKEGKRITTAFWASLPDLSLLPLTDSERHQIRLMRLEWLTRRRGNTEKLERASEVILACTEKLPTTAIAAILRMTNERVREFQKELGVALERPIRRRLEHQFATADECPTVFVLNRKEQAALLLAWQKARRAKGEVDATRLERSEAYKTQLLEKLQRLRAQVQQRDLNLLPQQCSGSCGETWPRSKAFFTSNFRTKDGLSERCKYCQFVTSLERRGKTPRRARGRVLGEEERVRVVEIVRAYGWLIPGILLRRLFRIGEGTLVRIRHELGVRITTRQSRAMMWRWVLGSQTMALELLSVTELAKLYLLTKELRRRLEARYDFDPDHKQFLLSERAQVRGAIFMKKLAPIAEECCVHCKEPYPFTERFFKHDGTTISHTCKACANYEQRQRRLKQLRKRFGG